MIENVDKGLGLVERLQKLGVPLSLLVPIAAIGAGCWYRADWMRLHWRLIAFAAVCYLAAVMVATFAGKVWREEFEQDAVKAAAGWLRAWVRRFAPGFKRRYHQQVIRGHEIFNVRGLGLIAAHTLKLEHVFVDLKISTTSNPAQFNFDPVTAEQPSQTRSIWDFVRAGQRAAKWAGEAVALVIVGPPGSGKTTLLQHVAVTLASGHHRRHRARASTPILLSLRDHSLAIANNPAITLGQLARQSFSARYPKLELPPEWFERQLTGGRCLALLDGLDEVARQEQRAAISRWVDAQIVNYPRCRFIITSRPQGYRAAPLERANIVEAQPFSNEQIRRFIQNWYLANEAVSSGNRFDEGVLERAAEGAADLLKRLRAPEAAAINALAVNPLMLTMIAMVHRYRGALPGSRVELYREICEVLLGRWRQAKGLQDRLSADQKRAVLMPLAAAMMERELREIPFQDAMEIIRQPLRRVGATGAEFDGFLHSMQASSGLIVEREAGRWSFAHLTFQEYLTAAWWSSGRNAPRSWRAVVENSWWHETLRLYAAQADATSILQTCLGAGSVAALTLAAEILEEGREIDEDVHRAVEERVNLALESDDREMRHLAAEVLLHRRLKSLRPMDERREIDPSFLSSAEYQLFLDEAQARGRSGQPDHWPGNRFPRGEARHPIRGIRAEDAAAFCEWLSNRQRGDVRYRLPRPEEAARRLPDVAGETETAPLAAWCDANGEFTLAPRSDSDAREIERLLAGLSSQPLSSTPHFALAREFDPESNRVFDHAIARTLRLDVEDARALAFDHALAFALARSHGADHAIARAGNSRFDGAVALPHLIARAHMLTRSLARALDFDLDRDRDPVEAINPTFDRLRELAALLDRGTDIAGARKCVEELLAMLAVSEPPARIAALIDDHLRIAGAKDSARLRQAWQIYAAHLLEYAYESLPQFPPHADTYWWLKIILARIDGQTPAWESLRIVREQRNAG
jgi:energy-coupling factor transporter ATP-binding protein EcfA2